MYRATCSKLCKLVGIIAWIINMYPYLYHFHSEWIFSSFKQSFRRTFQGWIPQNSMGKKDVTQFVMKKIDQLEQTRCIFFCDYIVQLKHSQRTYTHLYELRNANPTPKHLRRLSRQILEIDEIASHLRTVLWFHCCYVWCLLPHISINIASCSWDS